MTKPDLDPLDDKLRRAWHSNSSLAQIAMEFGMNASEVSTHWRRLRSQGRLPTRGRRLLSENQSDGRPSVNEFGEDPLADAFREGKR